MTKKTKIDFIISIILIICSSIILLLPLLCINNIKWILISILGIYALLNVIKFLNIRKTKDNEGLFTALISLVCIALTFVLNIAKPINLAIILLIWIFLMSLVKLKKADYYHDRENELWIVRVIVLFIFILIGLLTTINLYYSNNVQVLMLGNFFFVHGILELIDPLTNYIKESK